MLKIQNDHVLGKLTVWAGIAALITTLAVLIGMATGNWLLGSLGDLMDMANSALLVPLLLYMGATVGRRHNFIGRLLQVGGLAGAACRIVGAFLIFSGLLLYEDAVLLVNMGIGLMGSVVLIFFLTNRVEAARRRGYFLLSLAVGVAMTMNLLGAFLNDAMEPVLSGRVGVAEVNPFLLALLLFAPVFMFGFPIWLLWTGRLFWRRIGILKSQPELA